VFNTERSELKLQFKMTSIIRNGKITLEIGFDIDCFKTECSGVNEQVDMRRSIRIG